MCVWEGEGGIRGCASTIKKAKISLENFCKADVLSIGLQFSYFYNIRMNDSIYNTSHEVKSYSI